MFARSVHPAKTRAEGRGPGSRIGRLRLSLPSPFVLVVVLVFIVLPLVWPETGDPLPGPTLRAVLDLSSDVSSLAISSHGDRLVATSRNRPICVWDQDREAGWKESRLPLHQPCGARSLCVSPDGTLLAAGNVDGSISLWDLATDQPRLTLQSGKEMILGVAFSPDGATLAACSSDSRIYVWEVASGRLQVALEGHHGPVTALAFSLDGHTLASGGEDQTVRLWDVGNQRQTALLLGHNEVVLAVAFSSDGRFVASSSLCDQGIRLWDVGEKQSCGMLRGKVLTITCLAFLPDGQGLIAGDEHGTVTLWNLSRHREQTDFSAHQGWVKGLAISSEGRQLVTGGNDGLVRIWDLASMFRDRHPHS